MRGVLPLLIISSDSSNNTLEIGLQSMKREKQKSDHTDTFSCMLVRTDFALTLTPLLNLFVKRGVLLEFKMTILSLCPKLATLQLKARYGKRSEREIMKLITGLTVLSSYAPLDPTISIGTFLLMNQSRRLNQSKTS